MVLNHLAAIFVFSGPLFYVGLWMAVDPAGILTLSLWVLRVFRYLGYRLRGCATQDILGSDYAEIPRRLRRALRFVGVALLVFAIVI
jgi:hypothetical protein